MMRSVRVLLVFSCVALLGFSSVESRYLGDFNHGNDLNGSVYDWEIVTRNGIYKSGYAYADREKMRLEIIPYGKDSIFVRVRILETFVSSRNGDEKTEELQAVRPSKRVFEFILNDQGKIFVKKSEPKSLIPFVKNYASYLIFDFDKFKEGKNENKWIYSVDQPTTYGSCSINNIATAAKEGFVVEQTFDPHDCSNFRPTIFSDVEAVKDIQGLSINNYRRYHLLQRDSGGFFPEEIETSQKIFWKPTNKNSLTHFLEISHKITFTEALKLSLDDTDFDFSTPHDLEFVASTHDHFEDKRTARDLLFFYNLNSETLLTEIKNMIGQIADLWNRQKVSTPDDYYPTGQELTKTLGLLDYTTNEELVTLWEDFKKDTSEEGVKILNAYYRILPQVGTEGAVLLIRRLILEKEVSVEVGDKMLTKLVGSVRLPTMKVLEALQEIQRAINTDASLLAYSAAMGTALQNYPNSEKVKKWVVEAKSRAIDIINNSLNDYKKVRLFILGLANLRSVSFEEEAILALKNKFAKTNQDLYLYMIVAFENTTPSPFMFDLLLDVIRDPDYNYEIKAASVGIALKHLPSLKHFEVLARLMDTEQNYELYNLFESAVRSMIKINQLPAEAKDWIRSREPISRSATYAFYSPEDYPMRVSAVAYIVYNDTNRAFQTLYVDIYQDYHGRPVRQYSVLLRVSGMERFSSLSVKTFMMALFTDEKMSYELTVYKGDRVMLSSIDSFDIRSFVGEFMDFFDDDEFSLDPIKSEMEEIFLNWHIDYYFPTDFGENIKIYFFIPTSISTKFGTVKLSQDEKDTRVTILASLNYTAQSVNGLLMYQPKLEAFQGSREVSSFHYTQQIAFTAARDDKDNYYIELKDDVTPFVGLRVKKDTVVHFKKIGNDTFKFEDDKEFESIQKVYKKYIGTGHNDFLLFHSDIGAKFQVKIYDYDVAAGQEEFPITLSALLYQKPLTGFFTTNVGDWYVTFLSYLNWNFLAYSAYSYNFKATMEPCKIFPIKKYRFRSSFHSFYIEMLDKDDKLRVTYKFSDYGDDNQFLRYGPGLESFGICLRHPVDKPYENLYQVFYGTKIGIITECPKDQFQISLSTKSEFSNDQIENLDSDVFGYEECLNPSVYLPPRDTANSLNCLKAAASLRDFTANVNYKNPPKEFLFFLHQFWRWFQKTNEGVPSDNTLGVTDQGEIILKAQFPLSTNRMNLEVSFPNVKYSFKNLPRIIVPASTVFSDFHEAFEYSAPSVICTVVASEDQIKSNKHIYHNTAPWTLYSSSLSKVSVYVKKYGDKELALKLTYQDHTLTVLPHGTESESKDKYVITLGEKAVDELPMDWTSKRLRTFKILDTIFFASDAKYKDLTFAVGYNGHSVVIVGGSVDDFTAGKCFEHQDL